MHKNANPTSIHIYFSACPKVGMVGGVKAIYVGKHAVSFVAEGITDVEANNILRCQVTFRNKGLRFFSGIKHLRKKVFYMAVV